MPICSAIVKLLISLTTRGSHGRLGGRGHRVCHRDVAPLRHRLHEAQVSISALKLFEKRGYI